MSYLPIPRSIPLALACLLVSASTLLSACATSISYDNYLLRFDGMNEEELIALWREPSEVVDMSGGRITEKTLIYRQSHQANMMISPAIYQPYFDGKTTRQRIVQPERWQLVTRTCETIFIVSEDEVIASYYQGNGCIAPRE